MVNRIKLLLKLWYERRKLNRLVLHEAYCRQQVSAYEHAGYWLRRYEIPASERVVSQLEFELDMDDLDGPPGVPA